MLVGIDIDNATNKVELKKLVLSKLPGKVETAAALQALDIATAVLQFGTLTLGGQQIQRTGHRHPGFVQHMRIYHRR